MGKFLLGFICGVVGVVAFSVFLAFRDWLNWAFPDHPDIRSELFEIPYDPRTMAGWEFSEPELVN